MNCKNCERSLTECECEHQTVGELDRREEEEMKDKFKPPTGEDAAKPLENTDDFEIGPIDEKFLAKLGDFASFKEQLKEWILN